jgi:hypothetical protein
LGLTNNKIRFHGCHAVRHDDHLHVQLKWGASGAAYNKMFLLWRGDV